MKNLKLLTFGLLFCMLILAGCEKANNEGQYACEGDDICPIEGLTNNQENDEDEIIEEDTNEEDINEEIEEEVVVEDTISDQPMMRKMMVNENTTPEEIEAEMTETCANIGGTWSEGSCILEDGTTVMF